MTGFVEFLKEVMSPGGHGFEFCSALQFREGNCKLTELLEAVEALSDQEAEDVLI